MTDNASLADYRLVAVDLDGTLLGPDHRITPRNAAAVQALADRGVVCVIASGRMHEATTRYADEVGLRTPMISYNGGMVRDPVTDDVWLHRAVPRDVAEEVIEFCAVHGHHLNFYRDNVVYVAERGEWAEFYLRQTGSPMRVVGDLRPFEGLSPTKLILIDRPAVTDALLPRFRERFGEAVYITKSNPEYLEFMSPEADKGAALSVVCERLGIAREGTVAFGDGDNDIPMLRWAGLGIAMGHASERVKSAADLVAPAVGADGFAEIVGHTLLARRPVVSARPDGGSPRS